MSLLNVTETPSPDHAAQVAEQLKQRARHTYQSLVHSFNQGAYVFWTNPLVSATDLAAALGSDAKEIFELHGKIGALLSTINPAAIAPGLSVVGQFTYNGDGTVTIVTPPAPAPEPTLEPTPTA